MGSKWKVGAIGGEDEIVTRTLSQTLTGKTLTSPVITNPTGLVKADVGLGNVDNTSDLNKPISTATQTALDLKANLVNPTFDDGITMLHESTPSNPSSGRIRVYPKSDNRLYTLDSSGVETVVGSGTAGGFVNYITNPDAESTTVTPWATYADAAAATPADGTGGSPNVTWTRNTSSPIRGNADFAFAKDAANRQGQGVAFAFTLATTDRSKKCQITFDYDTSAANYAAGDLRVYIYDVTNAALITPQTVAIPKGTNTFQTTFDTTTSTSYRLILHVATTNATAYTVDFDNFVVNAGQVVQGAAVSEWQSITFAVPTGLGAGSGTNTAFFRRVGSDMELRLRFVKDGTPGSGTSPVTFTMPSGYTINTSQLNNGYMGYGSHTAANYGAVVDIQASGNTFYLREPNTATNYTGADMTAGSEMQFQLRIPISEWAGNGTVNLGPGAQVEYASTSGTWDADSSTTVHGPRGTQMGGSLGATRTKIITWQYPIQAGDVIVVEGSRDGVNFVPMNGFQSTTGTVIPGLDSGAANGSGVSFYHVNSTQTAILFGRYISIANDDAPVSNWSSADYWRVGKAKASSPVGYGLAGTDGSSGLYQAGRAPGLTTGATIASGYVGEILSSTTTTALTTSAANLASITLTPGVWTVSGGCRVGGDTNPRYMVLSISSTPNTQDTVLGRHTIADYNTGSGVVAACTFPRTFNVSVSTTVYLVGSLSSVSGLGTPSSYIEAVRIA